MDDATKQMYCKNHTVLVGSLLMSSFAASTAPERQKPLSMPKQACSRAWQVACHFHENAPCRQPIASPLRSELS